MRIWPRRRWDEPDPLDRFGSSCPVCGAPLGNGPAPWDEVAGRFAVSPSLRLEVGTPDNQSHRHPWRVTVLGHHSKWSVRSNQIEFSSSEVDFVYVLCGGGHIFPDSSPVFRTRRHDDLSLRIDDWNMVAAIGSIASGKTYVLVRMLSQALENTASLGLDSTAGRVRFFQASPLEELPLQFRQEKYRETVSAGHPIPATSLEATYPEGVLLQLLPEALDGIRALIIRTVVDGERRARDWGTTFRQPLVLRTDSDGKVVWTGVADLPGELFRDNRVPRETGLLRAFDALIWVVDPVVAPGATAWLPSNTTEGSAPHPDILNGSLRPGATFKSSPDVVRANRDHIQIELGDRLTRVDGPFLAEQGRTLRLLVVVSKCDLVHAALRKGAHLTSLGANGVVAEGAANYLSAVTRRYANGWVEADGSARNLLSYLHAAGTRAEVRRNRAYQVANGLLDHYSDADAFWDLVHNGPMDSVAIPDQVGIEYERLAFRVPSLSDHLDQALRPGGGRLVLLRDLVMSALGCGIAFGLGLGVSIFRLLQEEGQSLSFYLCSPLGTVPIAIPGDLLTPLDTGAHFPPLSERSAGLTQLLLAVLRRARK